MTTYSPTRVPTFPGPALALSVLALAMPQALAGGGQEIKLLPVDGAAGDAFGLSVSVDDTTAVVSAHRDDDNGINSGSAYLFDTTTGQQIAKLLPTDGDTDEVFGHSVGIAGSTVAAGAPRDQDNGFNSGSAYLFDTTTGQQIAKLLPTDGAADDHFGLVLAIDGSTVVVGAPRDHDKGSRSGSAYVFDTSTGQQVAKLLPADGSEDDFFGASVDVDGTTAVVGAGNDDDNGSDSGSAYLFDTTTGQQIAKLLPADGAPGDGFGASVAIHGSTVVVGAHGDDDNGTNSGSAYLFDAATGQQRAKLLPLDGAAGDLFGLSMAVEDTIVIVGGLFHDHNGVDSGSAYLFDTATGQQLLELLPSDGAAGDEFGTVALDGTTAIVGASLDDDNGSASGSAYVFCTSLWRESPVNGHWYHPLPAQGWADAEAQARSWGGHLATVRSQAENDWLRDTFATGDDLVWIGFTDRASEGTFEWTSGEPVTYTNWALGQPDDHLGADYAALRPGSGTWSDEPDLPAHAGVAEVVSDDCDGDGLPDAFEIALDPSLDWNGDGVLDECSSPNYCQANANSTGVPAVVSTSGTPVVAENDVTLHGTDLPPNQPAYFLTSESRDFVPGFGGSSGNLCLGSPIVRFNDPGDGGKVLDSGPGGAVSFSPDLNDLPQGTVFGPGDTWYFQLWYRDAGGTSNMTDGTVVMFR